MQDTKQNTTKLHVAKPGENQMQVSKHSVSVESHRIHLIPPATNCDMYNAINQGSSLKTHSLGFLLASGPVVTCHAYA